MQKKKTMPQKADVKKRIATKRKLSKQGSKLVSEKHRYIAINKKNLSVDVIDSPRKDLYCVPANSDGHFLPIAYIVYMDILYPARYAENARKGIANVHYCLMQPDPWLVAIAAIMWEGIVQGITWDAVKMIVSIALDKLRKNGLAPAEEVSSNPLLSLTEKKRKSHAETSVGFSWTKYSGRKKQYHLFVGLRRIYNSMNEEKRKKILK